MRRKLNTNVKQQLLLARTWRQIHAFRHQLSHHPLHRTNLKVKDSRGSYSEPSFPHICTYSPNNTYDTTGYTNERFVNHQRIAVFIILRQFILLIYLAVLGLCWLCCKSMSSTTFWQYWICRIFESMWLNTFICQVFKPKEKAIPIWLVSGRS